MATATTLPSLLPTGVTSSDRDPSGLFSFAHPARWYVKADPAHVTVTNFVFEGSPPEAFQLLDGEVKVDLVATDEIVAWETVDAFLKDCSSDGDSAEVIECRRELIGSESFGWRVVRRGQTVKRGEGVQERLVFYVLNTYGISESHHAAGCSGAVPEGPHRVANWSVVADICRSIRFL